MSAEQIRRANAELEDLLQQSLGPAGPRTRAERPGEEAQRPLGSRLSLGPGSRLSSGGSSGVDRLLASDEWQQPRVGSRPRSGEPSLLGSGWSWHNAREAAELLSTGASLNNTADSETLVPRAARLSVRATRAAEDSLLPSRAQEARPQAAGEAGAPGGRSPSQHSSRFTTSASESGDDWSASEDEDALASSSAALPEAIIGRGAFGSVYRTTWKGRPAALKVIEHDDELGRDADSGSDSDGGLGGPGRSQAATGSLSGTQADHALLEAAMSSAVCHPNVVQTYHYRTLAPGDSLASSDVSRAMRETHILMEFCDGGSLEEAVSDGRLADAGGADVDLERLCLTLLEVARAMEYLHRLHITHRDLKLANVLLKSSRSDPRGFTAKVSDFGLSRLLPDVSPRLGESGGEHTGTVTHMAPELLEKGGMSRAADVYAFGILMWEALMGEPAYRGISKMQVMFGVVSEGLRPRFPDNTPAWYAQVATACWRHEPRRRPTFSKVCIKLEEQLAILREARSDPGRRRR